MIIDFSNVSAGGSVTPDDVKQLIKASHILLTQQQYDALSEIDPDVTYQIYSV